MMRDFRVKQPQLAKQSNRMAMFSLIGYLKERKGGVLSPRSKAIGRCAVQDMLIDEGASFWLHHASLNQWSHGSFLNMSVHCSRFSLLTSLTSTTSSQPNSAPYRCGKRPLPDSSHFVAASIRSSGIFSRDNELA